MSKDSADVIVIGAGVSGLAAAWDLRKAGKSVIVEDISALNWDCDGGFDGKDAVFPNGFDEIAQNLAKGADIRFEHIVKKISYNEDTVTVSTDQGTFKGEYAVVTLPLGVLKKGTVEFDPPLPEKKQKAIKNLKMGLLNKLYLKFPKVF